MKVLFVYTGEENLGVEYLSASLKRAGHTTDLVYDPLLFDDFLIESPLLAKAFSFHGPLLQRILASRADLIAFPITSNYYSWACSYMEEIKKRLDVPIVVGGAHPTVVPESVIQNKNVDYLVRGEGEEALLELMAALESGEEMGVIPNVWYRKNGEVIQGPLRDPIADLDSLPFPDKQLFYSQVPYRNWFYTAITGRGCPFHCTFCSNSTFKDLYGGPKKYLRRRSVESVLEEVHLAKQNGAKVILFHDECFTYDAEWLGRFADGYKERVDIPYLCWVHPNTITPEVVAHMARSNCSTAVVGVESVDEHTRRHVMGRDTSDEQIRTALRLLREAGIAVRVDFIVGVPGQTVEEMIRTVEFCYDNDVRHPVINWLTYYPGTRIIDIAHRMGALSDEDVKSIGERKLTKSHQKGGDSFSRDFGKVVNLLILQGLLPKSMVIYLLKSGLYRFLPPVHNVLLPLYATNLARKIRGDKEDQRHARDAKPYIPVLTITPHYAYFLRKRSKLAGMALDGWSFITKKGGEQGGPAQAQRMMEAREHRLRQMAAMGDNEGWDRGALGDWEEEMEGWDEDVDSLDLGSTFDEDF